MPNELKQFEKIFGYVSEETFAFDLKFNHFTIPLLKICELINAKRAILKFQKFLELLKFLTFLIPELWRNPLVLPICLHVATHKECRSILNDELEFCRISESQLSMIGFSIPLLHLALIVATNSSERCDAARWLVKNTSDPNELALIGGSNRMKIQTIILYKINREKFFENVDQVSPLGIACALDDLELVKTLISLGSEPCLVCIIFLLNALKYVSPQTQDNVTSYI